MISPDIIKIASDTSNCGIKKKIKSYSDIKE